MIIFLLLSCIISYGQSCDVFDDTIDCNEALDGSLVGNDDRAIFDLRNNDDPSCKGSLVLDTGERFVYNCIICVS